MRASALLVTLGLLFGGESDAEACSCGRDARIRPEDGSIDVPLNARILVHAAWTEPGVKLKRRDDAAPVELAMEDELTEDLFYGVLLARPVAELEADTAYEVLIGEPPTERVVSTFTTGATRDEVAPEFSGATAIRPQLMRNDMSWRSSCWHLDWGMDMVVVEHPAYGADIAGVVMDVRREGDPAAPFRTIHPVPLEQGFDLDPSVTYLFAGNCSMTGGPALVDPGTYCVRITAFDLAGNPAGASTEVCGSTETCRLTDTTEVSTPCDPTPWSGGCAISRRALVPTKFELLLGFGFTALVFFRRQVRYAAR